MTALFDDLDPDERDEALASYDAELSADFARDEGLQ